MKALFRTYGCGFEAVLLIVVGLIIIMDIYGRIFGDGQDT